MSAFDDVEFIARCMEAITIERNIAVRSGDPDPDALASMDADLATLQAALDAKAGDPTPKQANPPRIGRLSEPPQRVLVDHEERIVALERLLNVQRDEHA
jgi:hypothetical protein